MCSARAKGMPVAIYWRPIVFSLLTTTSSHICPIQPNKMHFVFPSHLFNMSRLPSMKTPDSSLISYQPHCDNKEGNTPFTYTGLGFEISLSHTCTHMEQCSAKGSFSSINSFLDVLSTGKFFYQMILMHEKIDYPLWNYRAQNV